MTMRSAATLMSHEASRRPRPMADSSRSNFTNRSNCLSESWDLVGSKWEKHGPQLAGAGVDTNLRRISLSRSLRSLVAAHSLVETKEAAGKAGEEDRGDLGLSEFSDDSRGDLFPIGRCVADEIAQEIGMLPIVFGLLNLFGVGSTFAPHRLDCGQIIFLDVGNQPSVQLLSYLVFSRSADVRDGAFDEICNCLRCGWNWLGA